MHLVLKVLELSSQNDINIADISVIEFEPLEGIRDVDNIDQDPVFSTSPQSPKVINFSSSLFYCGLYFNNTLIISIYHIGVYATKNYWK